MTMNIPVTNVDNAKLIRQESDRLVWEAYKNGVKLEITANNMGRWVNVFIKRPNEPRSFLGQIENNKEETII